MKPEKHIDVEHDVLRKIERGQVKMRPRWEFVARAIGLNSGIVLGILVMIASLSLGLFVWQQYSVSHMLSLGLWGWKKVLLCFPFEIFGVMAAAFALILFLIRRSEWGYKHSWRFWTVIVLCVVMPLAYVGFRIQTSSERHRQRDVGQTNGLASYIGSRMQALEMSFLEGTIKTVTAHTISIVDTDDRPYTLQRRDIQLKPRYYTPQIGDRVMLLGEWRGTEFHVQAVVNYSLLEQRWNRKQEKKL